MKGRAHELPEILDLAAWLFRRRGHGFVPIYLAACLPALLALLLAGRERAASGGAPSPRFDRILAAVCVLLAVRALGKGLVVERMQRALVREEEGLRAAAAHCLRAAPAILYAGAIVSLLEAYAWLLPGVALPALLLVAPMYPLAVRRPELGLGLPWHAARAWLRAAPLQLALAGVAIVLGVLALLNAFAGVYIAVILAEGLLDVDATAIRPLLDLERPLTRLALGGVALLAADLAWIAAQTALQFRLAGSRTGEDLAAELAGIRERLAEGGGPPGGATPPARRAEAP